MKKLLLLTLVCSSTLIIGACASPGESGRDNPNYNSDVNSYGNTPDNPMVNSREASSAEFPQENQF